MPSKSDSAEPGRFAVYPYREEEDLLFDPGHRVIRPTLDIDLSFHGQDWRTKALVDTGAPICVFDHLSAVGLGISTIDESAKQTSIRVGGERRSVMLAFVTLALPEFPDLFWDAEVGFLRQEWPVPYGILGDSGFLERWVVSFNRYRNYLVVEPVDDWENRQPLDVFEEFQKLDDEWERPGD